jgi:hypothetical protein
MKIMLNKFKSTFLEDLKTISLNYSIIIPLCVIFLISIIIPFCLHVVTHHEYLYHGVQPAKYYTLISVTLVSLIPVLNGIAFGRLVSDKIPVTKNKESWKVTGNVTDSTYVRIFTSLLISFILIILSIWLIKPVPSQGWLRTLYAAMLLSVQTPFVLLLVGRMEKGKIAGLGTIKLYWIFLIALPVGLLVHHPWNYFAFFSPFYWIAWAWMIKPPLEAIICGSIAVILSSIILFLMLKYYQHRHSA